ncbi:creatininase family protein [Prochlorococcus sp. MIT 1300]|uniref:creatininase family protein n=1 Tax=Prochlorococcus sp. MIT 1300 TaxID=3096218 RepID=UPI002A755110|nr:creatininase family protein [Prochlorococcus sp. MIT 1300]
MTLNFRRFDYLSWPEAAVAARAKGSTLIWPFGACEQHGPHLPLVTDNFFAEQILLKVLDRMPKECPLWMLPSQSFGFSPEHSSFPGTISISASLLLQIVMEVGEQLASLGVRRLLFFNAHGGQIGLLQAAGRELRMKCPEMAVLPCFIWSGVQTINDVIPPKERIGGLHAGLAETSLMLSLAPELVGGDRPSDGVLSNQTNPSEPPYGWSLEGPAPCSWLTEDLSQSGVIGDSSKSSRALGQKIEEALISHWVELFSSLMASNWPPVKPFSSS